MDDQGRPETGTDPQGTKTQTTYNDLGLPETITDWVGNATRLEYDTKGNAELATTPGTPANNFTYFPNGNWKTSTVNGATTTLEYNVFGDRTATVSPFSARTESDYDANGNNTVNRETRTVNGVTVIFSDTTTFDANDRSIATVRVVTENGVPRTLWTTTKRYNAMGQVDRETDQHGNPTEYTYDTLGRVIETRRRVEDETGAHVWLTMRWFTPRPDDRRTPPIRSSSGPVGRSPERTPSTTTRAR